MSTAAMAPAATLPPDVRWVNLAAQALFALAALLALVGAGWWAVRHPAWALAGISVHGDVRHQNAVAVRAQLASRLQGGFLTVDLLRVQRLFESLPWVRRAVVQRQFPNRLKVTLEEHQAAAWWGEAGGGRLVNRQGEVFEANPDDPQADEWLELLGPEGRSAEVLALYLALEPVLQPLQRDVQRLELTARGGWRLLLDGDAVVELGRGTPEEITARVRLWVGTLTQIAQRYGQQLEAADLRYPNGYALRLRGVTTLADKAAPTTPLQP